MTCQNCGAEIAEGQTTCPSCRAAVVPPPPAQGASAPPADGRQPIAPADVAAQPPSATGPEARSEGPIVPPPEAQQTVQPPVLPGAVPPPPGQAPPVHAPYPYAAPQYPWPAPPPKRQGKPVVLIIIIVLTFLGAFGCLMQAVMGQPSPFFGIMLSGAPARLAALFWLVLGVGVGVGLILMSRWGWWLAISQCVLSLLAGVLSIPHMDMIVSAAMDSYPASMPPQMMAMMEAMMPVIMGISIVFGMLYQAAIIAYLVWKRELFGIDVEPASESEGDRADSPPGDAPEPPGPESQQQ